jgi:hypothetical protein
VERILSFFGLQILPMFINRRLRYV